MPMHYDSDFHAWIDDEAGCPPAPIPAEHMPFVSPPSPPSPPQLPSYGLNGMDKFSKQKRQKYVRKGVGCLLMLPALILILRSFLPLLTHLLTWDALVIVGVIFALLFGFFSFLLSED